MTVLWYLLVHLFDAISFPEDDKVPANEINIFRGEDGHVLFINNLSNCREMAPWNMHYRKNIM